MKEGLLIIQPDKDTTVWVLARARALSFVSGRQFIGPGKKKDFSFLVY